MAGSCFTVGKDGVTLAVRVVPGASKAGIDGIATLADGQTVVRLRVRAAPREGEANKAVQVLLARELSTPRSRVRLVAGATSRIKRFHVEGSPVDLKAAVNAWTRL